MKILLKRDDVIPDKSDHKGRSPLWVTTSKGLEGVVKKLLARDGVTPNEAKKIPKVEHHPSELFKGDMGEGLQFLASAINLAKRQYFALLGIGIRE